MVKAQFSMENILSPSQQLIEEAIKDGVFVVHSCYRLQDTTSDETTYYAWRNLAYFGDTYSLGVKVKKGYFTSDMANHPWKYDAKYEEYRRKNRYKPVISENYYRQINDTGYLSLSLENRSIKEISTNRIYLVEDTVFQNQGFDVDNTNGLKKGWLVWVVTDKPLSEEENQEISFLIYRNELIFEAEKDTYNIETKNLPRNKTILCGIYVFPKQQQIGEITFLLCGYLHMENAQWQVVRYTNYEKENSVSDDLTPLPLDENAGKNKNKKNSNK
jgi:hypothetical protein